MEIIEKESDRRRERDKGEGEGEVRRIHISWSAADQKTVNSYAAKIVCVSL